MDSRNEVVITGLGAVSPLGIGKDTLWGGVLSLKSGVRLLPWLAETPTQVQIGAEVVEFNPKQYVRPRKALKVMSPEIQQGYVAAALAREDAKLDPTTLDPDRLGVVFGADMLYCHPEELAPIFQRCMEGGEFDFGKFGPAAAKELFPLWMLLYLPNMVACHIGISIDARGPTNTITHGEVGGLQSVIEAARVIERGHADVMLAGGVGNRLSPTPLVYRADLYLSHRNDDPAAASRPFDADRDGMVRGEGAAAFVLERRDHAERRGAPILARLLGGVSRFGRTAAGATSTAAIESSIGGALTEAGMHADQISGVVAHGLSTQHHDPLEAAAIASVLGDTPVTAPRSFYGNAGAASSALDLVVAIQSVVHNRLPATLNYETPDPACPVHVVSGEAIEPKPGCLITLSQSTSGQAAAVVLDACTNL